MNFYEPSIKKTITQAVGAHMTFASIIGIYINVRMFLNFRKLEKSSFYILCTSKTVSNSLSLTGYLLFIAPTGYFYTQLGSDTFNSYMNQFMSFGLYLQGPTIQMMITVNRFLVVWFSPQNIGDNVRRVTVAFLTISWAFTAWFSTLFGLPEKCKSGLGYGHLEYFKLSPCATQVIWFFVYALFFLAVFTNTMNILIAGKLIYAVKIQKALSSETSKERLRRSRRFFLQSCLQDWISVLDVFNNIVVSSYIARTYATLITLGFDVMVYGVDGYVMYFFNKREVKKTVEPKVFERRISNNASVGPTVT